MNKPSKKVRDMVLADIKEYIQSKIYYPDRRYYGMDDETLNKAIRFIGEVERMSESMHKESISKDSWIPKENE